MMRSAFEVQYHPWISEVTILWGPNCSHISFCMVADHMHVYSAVHYALIDLCATWHVDSQVARCILLDVPVAICLSMLASNINCLTVPGREVLLHPLA